MTSVTVNKVRTYHITIYLIRLLSFHPNRVYEIPELHGSTFYFIIFTQFNEEFLYILLLYANKSCYKSGVLLHHVRTEQAGRPR